MAFQKVRNEPCTSGTHTKDFGPVPHWVVAALDSIRWPAPASNRSNIAVCASAAQRVFGVWLGPEYRSTRETRSEAICQGLQPGGVMQTRVTVLPEFAAQLPL